MSDELSEFVTFEISPIYSREVFTATAACKKGDVISNGATSPTYGIAIADAAKGEAVVVVVRGAVATSAINGTADAKTALKAQGVKIA